MSDNSNKKVVYDPLIELIEYYSKAKAEAKVEEKKFAVSIEEKLKLRIVDGDKIGLQTDLDEALKKYSALDIINKILLDGMKTVGELFGSGQMQLPFVLQSAEVMKNAVSYLEQFMDKTEGESKGKIVLATVKGDVHDIGKNLVDIILTNNGFTVYNLGIKCPIETMIEEFDKQNADAIGMSGLLVKSTLIMKENLEIMNEQDLRIPVVLGGAALTRRYVENDLSNIYEGYVSYAADAFDGLRFMGKIKSGDFYEIKKSIVSNLELNENQLDTLVGSDAKITTFEKENMKISSRITKLEALPKPPFWGVKIVRDIQLDEIFPYINQTALFRGQWQYRKKNKTDEEYQIILEEKVLPVFENLKREIQEKKLLIPEVVYGYFPAKSDGNNIIIYVPKSYDETRIINMWEYYGEINNREFKEFLQFEFPRQPDKRHLCIADFITPIESDKFDVIAFQVVTVGKIATEYSQQLFNKDQYTDYLYFHGMSVETAEALAEYWHKKIRQELNIADKDAKDIKKLFQQGYRGSRFSLGYPACPNLEDQAKLFKLLDPSRIDVSLTEEYQMIPEQSTSAIIIHHPEARYFLI
jgi:5-methyltetrahydrofolate--homocysteine methyltransferase